MRDQILVGQPKCLVTRAEQVEKNLARRRIEVGKGLRRLHEALVSREIFEQKHRHLDPFRECKVAYN